MTFEEKTACPDQFLLTRVSLMCKQIFSKVINGAPINGSIYGSPIYDLSQSPPAQ